MIKYFRLVGLALFLSVGLASVGTAASFDCSKATTETEIAICADPELSALDRLMGMIWSFEDRTALDVLTQKTCFNTFDH